MFFGLVTLGFIMFPVAFGAPVAATFDLLVAAGAGADATLTAAGSGFLTSVALFDAVAADLAEEGLTMPTIACVIDLTVLTAFLAMAAGLEGTLGAGFAAGLTTGLTFATGLMAVLAGFAAVFTAALGLGFGVVFVPALVAGLAAGLAADFAAAWVAFAAVGFDLAAAAALAGAFTAFDFAATIALPFV